MIRRFHLVMLAAMSLGKAVAQQSPQFALSDSSFGYVVGNSGGGEFTLAGQFIEPSPQTSIGGAFGLSGMFLNSVPATDLPAPPTPLLRNGDFENTDGSFVHDGRGIISLPVGSTSIPGWTVVNAEIGWCATNNIFGPTTPYGSYFLDLTGYHDSRPYGGIAQTLPTTPGHQYRLTFALGADQSQSSYRGPMSVAAIIDTTTNLFTFAPATPPSGNVWRTFTRTFFAADSSTFLNIRGTAARAYLGLDNVSLRSASGQELLVNGSFEDGRFFAPNTERLMSLPPGSILIPSWTTTDAELVLGENSNPYGAKTPAGALFLDLTGYHDNPPFGGVSQTVTTVPGQEYTLSLQLGVFQDSVLYRGPVSVAVTFGTETSGFTLTPEGGGGNQWETFTLDFTATSASTSLALIGVESGGGGYLGLDHVSLAPLDTPPTQITNLKTDPGTLRFSVPANASEDFLIEARADLVEGIWESYPTTGTQNPDGTIEVQIPIELRAHRFFRIKKFSNP